MHTVTAQSFTVTDQVCDMQGDKKLPWHVQQERAMRGLGIAEVYPVMAIHKVQPLLIHRCSALQWRGVAEEGTE